MPLNEVTLNSVRQVGPTAGPQASRATYIQCVQESSDLNRIFYLSEVDLRFQGVRFNEEPAERVLKKVLV